MSINRSESNFYKKNGYLIKDQLISKKDIKKLNVLIKKFVTDRFDHRNLNLDVEEFKNLIPTAENIAVVIYNILRDQIDSSLDLKVTLYETERNFVEYPA